MKPVAVPFSPAQIATLDDIAKGQSKSRPALIRDAAVRTHLKTPRKKK